jgi:membrane fusion protein, multidrug efflux system
VRNPNRGILPGQFVRVHIDGLQIDNVIGLPRKAVLTNGAGHFVWVLDQQNTAQQRQIALGINVGDSVIVKTGLARGDRVVIDGVMKVAAGERVSVSMPALADAAATGTTSGSRIKSSE